ncbi:hypothetical protein LCGC14_1897080 [marine sediment metagenome]|uniref:Uncharacterized protein n=1 Tax=marine sediment metagenome TaxID=412755 RepID=A0A0F9IVT6_9ZZZZ
MEKDRNKDTCSMDLKSDKPMREPKWGESGIEVKVEKLRNVVRNLEREFVEITKYMNQLIGHSHVDGKIVKELLHPHSIEASFYPYKSTSLD